MGGTNQGPLSYWAQQIGINEAEEFALCLFGMPVQDNLILLGRDCNPQRTEVLVLLKLPWLAVGVFANVLAEIPGQIDQGGSRPGPLYVDLPCALPTIDHKSPI
jgi:hypothetical protein